MTAEQQTMLDLLGVNYENILKEYGRERGIEVIHNRIDGVLRKLTPKKKPVKKKLVWK
jgi:hypothetical protein